MRNKKLIDYLLELCSDMGFYEDEEILGMVEFLLVAPEALEALDDKKKEIFFNVSQNYARGIFTSEGNSQKRNRSSIMRSFDNTRERFLGQIVVRALAKGYVDLARLALLNVRTQNFNKEVRKAGKNLTVNEIKTFQTSTDKLMSSCRYPEDANANDCMIGLGITYVSMHVLKSSYTCDLLDIYEEYGKKWISTPVLRRAVAVASAMLGKRNLIENYVEDIYRKREWMEYELLDSGYYYKDLPSYTRMILYKPKEVKELSKKIAPKWDGVIRGIYNDIVQKGGKIDPIFVQFQLATLESVIRLGNLKESEMTVYHHLQDIMRRVRKFPDIATEFYRPIKRIEDFILKKLH